MSAYYNEIDPQAAEWLRELIRRGLIAPGDVDERSIEDVRPDDLVGYSQCHWFAGLGVWSHSLRRAGWPDDRPVWTGSCPCQPWSVAGRRQGGADARHLWPEWFRLIEECRPPVIFGEQVASAGAIGVTKRPVAAARAAAGGNSGRVWIDAVFDDLESARYACGAVVFPACSVGAPHIRQRLYFVAEPVHSDWEPIDGPGPNGCNRADGGRQEAHGEPGACGSVRTVADAECDPGSTGRFAIESGEGTRTQEERPSVEPGRCSLPRILGDSESAGLQERDRPRGVGAGWARATSIPAGPTHILGNAATLRRTRSDRAEFEAQGVREGCPTRGFWRDAIWLLCRDGKARAVEPCPEPLADGTTEGVVRSGDCCFIHPVVEETQARVMRLRGYGNALVAPQAEAFIRAAMEVLG